MHLQDFKRLQWTYRMNKLLYFLHLPYYMAFEVGAETGKFYGYKISRGTPRENQ